MRSRFSFLNDKLPARTFFHTVLNRPRIQKNENPNRYIFPKQVLAMTQIEESENIFLAKSPLRQWPVDPRQKAIKASSPLSPV